jgi:hypothetical protein
MLRGSCTCAPIGRLAGTVALLSLFVGCQSIPFEPAPVVPTKNRFPHSVHVMVTDLGAYTVDPGATMLTDPNLQNRVTGPVASLTAEKAPWEKAIAEYVSTRRTFRSVVTDGKADLDMLVRLVLYIDPSVGFKFNTIYVARADVQLVDPGTGRPIGEYTGFGKASGVVRRAGPRDDEGPVNQAVHAALNDLFGKLEIDKRLHAQVGSVVVR